MGNLSHGFALTNHNYQGGPSANRFENGHASGVAASVAEVDHVDIDSAKMVTCVRPRCMANVGRLVDRKAKPIDNGVGICLGVTGPDRHDNRDGHVVGPGDRWGSYQH